MVNLISKGVLEYWLTKKAPDTLVLLTENKYSIKQKKSQGKFSYFDYWLDLIISLKGKSVGSGNIH